MALQSNSEMTKLRPYSAATIARAVGVTAHTIGDWCRLGLATGTFESWGTRERLWFDLDLATRLVMVGEFTERYGAKRRAALVEQLPPSLSTVRYIACDGETLEIRSDESNGSLFRPMGQSRRRSLIYVPELLARLSLALRCSQKEVYEGLRNFDHPFRRRFETFVCFAACVTPAKASC
jgi:hypothetical protein